MFKPDRLSAAEKRFCFWYTNCDKKKLQSKYKEQIIDHFQYDLKAFYVSKTVRAGFPARRSNCHCITRVELGCRFKANCPLVGPGSVEKVPSVWVFLTGPSPYLSEFQNCTMRKISDCKAYFLVV